MATSNGEVPIPAASAPGAASWGSVRRALENPWLGFLLRRAVSLVVILIVLVVASFALVRLIPGDPAANIAGTDATPASIAAIRHELGLDQPLLHQFLHYWSNLLHGQLGASFQTQQPVGQLLSQRAPSSLELAGVSVLFVMLMSIPIGIVAGGLTSDHRHRKFESALTAFTSVVGSIPEYLTGTFLALIFAVLLHLLPVAGSNIILPMLAISLRPTAVLIRLVRVETINVLATDYIRTARSKRLPTWQIYLRHTLPNVVSAALTIGGVLFAGIIGGAVVVENIFDRTGLGTALVNAVLSQDYPVVQAVILVLGATVVVVNAAVDITVAAVNPRSIAKSA